MLTHLGLSFTLTTIVNVQTLPCLSHNHCKEESVKSVKIVAGSSTLLLDYECHVVFDLGCSQDSEEHGSVLN